MKDLLIDPTTGQLKITSRGWEFGPDITLQKFLASDIANSGKKISKISEHYQLRTQLENGWLCNIILMFLGDALAQILLGFSERELTWADWSLEGERARQKMYDDFLLAKLGSPPYVFSWGRVASVLDPKNQEAYILIQYNKK